jgi:EAL domain-containing protein (putative c-di-GMP-specific phosphodiesterase class I)
MGPKAATTITKDDLRRALREHEFIVHYQPQVDLKTGQTVAVEALLRWNMPGVGLVPPLDFIPLAEQSGDIVPIGEWVLRESCRQTRAWEKSGLPPLGIAVNLSARQFQQQDLAAQIAGALKESGLAPHQLDLEITESHAMQDAEFTLSVFHDLQAMGVRISIDDFGTGYSSLGFLKQFPINTIKIDRSFIKDLASDPKDEAIVSAIVVLAHRLGLDVVAEGVETEAEVGILRRHHCDKMQGYFYSKPLPAEALEALVRSGKMLPG